MLSSHFEQFLRRAQPGSAFAELHIAMVLVQPVLARQIQPPPGGMRAVPDMEGGLQELVLEVVVRIMVTVHGV